MTRERISPDAEHATAHVEEAARARYIDGLPQAWPLHPVTDLCVLVMALGARVAKLEEDLAEVRRIDGDHAHGSAGHAHEPI